MHSKSLATVLGIVSCWSALAHACNVPVFRFALERWKPDPYRLVLVHDGPLQQKDQVQAAPLREREDESPKNTNLVLREFNLRELDSNKKDELVSKHDLSQFPSLMLHYPEHLQIPTPVWSGALHSNATNHLLDSPVRKELVKRLVDGQSAVWLFLESGDPAKDDPAAELVESELRRLERDLKLPELTESPDDALLATTPLRIAFSMIRVPRGAAEEQLLVEMLLRCEPDLRERNDPLVFPVFGRGRALFPLVGPGITKENISEEATFLVGPCSCQVKELNPGFDLLLAANWESLLALEGVALTAIADQERKSLTGEIELVPIPRGSAGAVSQPPASDTTPAVASAPISQDHGVVSHTPQRKGLNALGTSFVSLLVGVGAIAAILLALRR